VGLLWWWGQRQAATSPRSSEQSGPLHPPGAERSPSPPRHSPYLAHVELEEPPLLLHVLGRLCHRRLGRDDPSQAGSLLLLLHLPPTGPDGGLGTALPRRVSHGGGYSRSGETSPAPLAGTGWTGALLTVNQHRSVPDRDPGTKHLCAERD